MSPFIQGSYIGSLAMAAADDIIIATAMVYLLRSQRTGVKRYWRLKIGGVLDIYRVICQHKLHSGQDHNIFHQYRTINQVRFQSTRVYGASHLALVLCKLSSSSPYVPYFIPARTCAMSHTLISMSPSQITSSSHSTYSSTTVRNIPLHAYRN